MPSCTLLGRFSRKLRSAYYSWGISFKWLRAYFIDSGAIPRRQLLKSAPCGKLKSTLVAPSLAPTAYCVCKLRWNLVVSGSRILAMMVPRCTWSSRSVPWVWDPWPRYTSQLRSHLQVHYDGNRTLVLKSMAQVHKSTPAAPSSTLLRQPYFGSEIHGLGTQAHSGGSSRLQWSHS
jgi:hypothetical protein